MNSLDLNSHPLSDRNTFSFLFCVAHVKKVKSHITKLEDRSVQMVLFGYEGSKAYRVYNPTTNKVYVTRDVMFEEDRMWNWTPHFYLNTRLDFLEN
jgi:hypothetical protein